MIEHKYLKLFYRFCKENNLIKFLPKTFDEDLKAIKNKESFIIISDDLYESIKSTKKSLKASHFILRNMSLFDSDTNWDTSRIDTSKKNVFFPESLICLLRKKSRYTNDTLLDFITFYGKWGCLIRNEIKDDFFTFMNSSVIDKKIMPYKLSILRYAENETSIHSKYIILSAYKTLKPLIKKDYQNNWELLDIYLCFGVLHKQWYNYLLSKL